MNLEKDIVREIKKLIVFTAIIFLCIWKYEVVFQSIHWILDVITPFLIGGAIAFIIGIPVSYIEKKLLKKKRKWIEKSARFISIVIVITCVLVAINIFLLFLLPELGSAILHLEDSMRFFLSGVEKKSKAFFDGNEEILRYIDKMEFDWNRLTKIGIEMLGDRTGQIIGSAAEVIHRIAQGITTFFIAFVFGCYILWQRERLSIQGKKVLYALIPEGKADAVIEVLELSGHTFAGFLTGQCMEALILGCMFGITLLVFQMPYALLISAVIAVTALVPVFGAFAGCAIGMVLIFIESPSKVILFLTIFLVLQQIEGNLIYPKVVGNSVGLPSIWVLVAVTTGGRLMGIIGMLIFIPIASVSYALFREVIYLLLKKRDVDVEKI